MTKRVSEVVTDYKDWQKGDIITITAGTGAGKSHFIKNSLYIHAKESNKRILMLVHRLNCLDQFQYEIQQENKTDVITLATYQSIEHNSLNGVKGNVNHPTDFDYVVCDEFHYFMSDASFNKTTDLSLKAILDAEDSIRVFMSATGDYVERYLKNYLKYSVKPYRLTINFDFIKTLEFYNDDETIDHYINLAIEGNYKSIFFIETAQKAYELHKKYQEYSMFNCSKSNELYKHVDEEKVNDMLENERFEDLILFTTTTMDTGVNIKDREINNIVCDVDDVRTLQQCIGRKRLQNKDDYIHLVIKGKHNQQLGGRLGQLNQEMTMADYLRENGARRLINKFPRQYDKARIIYDKWKDDSVTKEINELAYFKCRTDQVDIQEMINLGEYGYCKYVANNFGFYDKKNDQYDYIIQENEVRRDNLKEYLDSMVGEVMLQVKDRTELIERLNVRDGNNNRLLRGIETLNGMLRENNYNYIIDEFRTSKQVDGKRKYYRSAWRVRRLSDN